MLAAARWLPLLHDDADAPSHALSGEATGVMAAIVPALLDGALPDDARERRQAIDETVRAVGTAIAGLPDGTRAELSTLFTLLALAPVRIAFANVDFDWRDADVATTNAFLVRLQKSRWAVKRIAYDALHQLTFAAWYANPRTWPSIGYPGPPALS